MKTEDIDTKKWIVIINRKSGKRKFIKQTEFVKQSLQKVKIDFDFLFTQYKGHAIEIAKENANRGYTQFLILGGDGTINEVVNGIMKSRISDTSHIKIALIPRGTGNDWVRFWTINKDDKKAFTTFLKGKTHLIDVGKAVYQTHNHQKEQQRFFINSIGFGLDAVVVNHVDKYRKLIGSFSFLYTIGVLQGLFHNRYISAKVKIDNQTFNLPLYTMNIANGCYSGGGIKQNPNAIPYDGLFDMMLVGKIKQLDILKTLPNIFNGKITESKVVQFYQAQKVEVTTDKPIHIETDGISLAKTTSCSIHILPNALQMIVP